MNISREFELLLYCLKRGSESTLSISRLKENIDWKKWITLLIDHGVLPQVYMNIKNRPIEGFPVHVLEDIKNLFYLNTSRNTMVCSHLHILVKTMQSLEEKITVIPFKGPVLAVQAYNDYAYRSYSDLDVLIDKRDFSRFYDHMINLGYQPLYPFKENVKKWWAAWGRPYVFSKKDIHVDVHFRIQTGPGFVKPGASPRSMEKYSEIDLMGQRVNALSPGYSVLAVCINASKDGWNRLCFVTDLAYLVQNNRDLEWDSLISRAKKMKVYTRLCIGLRLANEFLELQLPKETRQDNTENTKVAKLSRVYSNNLKKGKVLQKKFSSRILAIRTVDTVWGKSGYFCYYLFVPTFSDLKAISIPGFLFPLYFFLRPLMLLIKMFRRQV
jgi:hypothetical protein